MELTFWVEEPDGYPGPDRVEVSETEFLTKWRTLRGNVRAIAFELGIPPEDVSDLRDRYSVQDG